MAQLGSVFYLLGGIGSRIALFIAPGFLESVLLVPILETDVAVSKKEDIAIAVTVREVTVITVYCAIAQVASVNHSIVGFRYFFKKNRNSASLFDRCHAHTR
jgi:hypothetical protein